MKGYYAVTVEVEVINQEPLHRAARHRALAEGMSEPQADEILSPDGDIDEAACLQMLIDPGSLDGCSVIQSSVESY